MTTEIRESGRNTAPERDGTSPPWYRDAVFYGIDVPAFRDSNGDGIGDLPGVTQGLEYLAWLGVTAIWLLPFYPSPRRDNGYDVRNYLDVDPQFGTLEDVRALTAEAHRRGIRVVIDLVVNHTSDEHPWFVDAQQRRDSPFHDFYVWTDDPTDHARRENAFPGAESDVWSRVDRVDAWYLHHFYRFEPDLNNSNPAVQREIRRIVAFWLDLGVDGFRIDAAPYLGDNLTTWPPNPHPLLRTLRSWVESMNPDAVLLAEADLDPVDLAPYFGRDDNEIQLAYNFILNQYLYLALADASNEPIRRALSLLPDIPHASGWVNFLRNDDELNLSHLSPDERDRVFRRFAPDPSMRIFDRGIRRRLASLLDEDSRVVECLFSLLFWLPGTPLMVYGDEIGVGDDLSLPERYAARTPMSWRPFDGTFGRQADAPHRRTLPPTPTTPADPEEVQPLLTRLDGRGLAGRVRVLIGARKATSSFRRGTFQLCDDGDAPAVLASTWTIDRGCLLALHNLGANRQRVHLEPATHTRSLVVGSEGLVAPVAGEQDLELPPYGYCWLRCD